LPQGIFDSPESTRQRRERYLAKAEEAEAMARRSESADIREGFRQVASHWRRMVEEIDVPE
jgi:hypothetical protein